MLDEIKYLTHITSISNLKSIFKNGYLFNPIELIKQSIDYKGGMLMKFKKFTNKDFGTDFPGIFMNYITKDKFNDPFFGKILLVFSKDLLKQKNYHINVIDSNGLYVEGVTYFPHNISEAPKYKDIVDLHNNKNEVFPGNEIVFHDKININTLCGIWLGDFWKKDIYDELLKIVPNKFKHLIKIKKKYTDIKCESKDKYLDLVSKPFVISFNPLAQQQQMIAWISKKDYYKKIYLKKTKNSSSNYYKKIAQIVNIDDETIKKFNLTNPKKLYKYLSEKRMYLYYFNFREKQNLQLLHENFYN
jgi:hypothetical protein